MSGSAAGDRGTGGYSISAHRMMALPQQISSATSDDIPFIVAGDCCLHHALPRVWLPTAAVPERPLFHQRCHRASLSRSMTPCDSFPLSLSDAQIHHNLTVAGTPPDTSLSCGPCSPSAIYPPRPIQLPGRPEQLRMGDMELSPTSHAIPLPQRESIRAVAGEIALIKRPLLIRARQEFDCPGPRLTLRGLASPRRAAP